MTNPIKCSWLRRNYPDSGWLRRTLFVKGYTTVHPGIGTHPAGILEKYYIYIYKYEINWLYFIGSLPGKEIGEEETTSVGGETGSETWQSTSSEPSAQSLEPSHLQRAGMHRFSASHLGNKWI